MYVKRVFCIDVSDGRSCDGMVCKGRACFRVDVAFRRELACEEADGRRTGNVDRSRLPLRARCTVAWETANQELGNLIPKCDRSDSQPYNSGVAHANNKVRSRQSKRVCWRSSKRYTESGREAHPTTSTFKYRYQNY